MTLRRFGAIHPSAINSAMVQTSNDFSPSDLPTCCCARKRLTSHVFVTVDRHPNPARMTSRWASEKLVSAYSIALAGGEACDQTQFEIFFYFLSGPFNLWSLDPALCDSAVCFFSAWYGATRLRDPEVSLAVFGLLHRSPSFTSMASHILGTGSIPSASRNLLCHARIWACAVRAVPNCAGRDIQKFCLLRQSFA
jgi:hypothetical protein